MGFLFVILVFVVCVGGCYWLFTSVFDLLFGRQKETFVDKSVHHHYHTHNHEHKSISIIDDKTKENIFELKKSIEK